MFCKKSVGAAGVFWLMCGSTVTMLTEHRYLHGISSPLNLESFWYFLTWDSENQSANIMFAWVLRDVYLVICTEAIFKLYSGKTDSYLLSILFSFLDVNEKCVFPRDTWFFYTALHACFFLFNARQAEVIVKRHLKDEIYMNYVFSFALLQCFLLIYKALV